MNLDTGNNYSSKKCIVIKKNFDICMKKRVDKKNCDFYKKVLQMCMTRKKKIFMSEQIRQLAAILYTDIVGYTSMMQHDESTALLKLEHHRQGDIFRIHYLLTYCQ